MPPAIEIVAEIAGNGGTRFRQEVARPSKDLSRVFSIRGVREVIGHLGQCTTDLARSLHLPGELREQVALMAVALITVTLLAVARSLRGLVLPAVSTSTIPLLML